MGDENRIHVRVSAEMKADLAAIAEVLNTSPVEIMRAAADAFLGSELATQRSILDRWTARQTMRGAATDGPGARKGFENVIKTARMLMTDAAKRGDDELRREVDEWLRAEIHRLAQMIGAGDDDA